MDINFTELVTTRLQRISENFGYPEPELEVARPNEFNYSSKEAQALIQSIVEDVESMVALGCDADFAMNQAFIHAEASILVFFRIFTIGDIVRLKIDTGNEILACVCGLEEIYPSEIDDSFDYECEDEDCDEDCDEEVAEDDEENAEEETPVALRLWFVDIEGKPELGTCLLSHIVRAEFVGEINMDCDIAFDCDACMNDCEDCLACEFCDD